MNPDRQALLREFIRHLASAVATASIYPLEHRQVTNLCNLALNSLLPALGKETELALMRIDDQLVVDGKPLGGMHPSRLASVLKHRGIGHLKITRLVRFEEILALVGALAKRREGGGEIRSSENVRLGKVQLRFRPDRQAAPGAAPGKPAENRAPEAAAGPNRSDLTAAQLERLAEIYTVAQKKKQLNVVGISEIVASFVRAFTREADPLLALAPLREMDEATFTHSLNVCILNLAQASALGIEGPLLHDIGIAALLHDVGKLKIPKEILNKKEPLSEEDWEIICRHPVDGAKFLLDAPGVPRLAVVTAYEHHLRFDGTGYPKSRGRWEQNISSQMTTLADMFDAMASHQAYRQANGLSEVASTLKYLGGTQLHPLLAENFIRLLKKCQPELEIA